MKMIYNIIFYPLKLLFDIVFDVFLSLSGSLGLSLIGLSIFISTITLPLSLKVEQTSSDDFHKRQQFEKMSKHIKRVFHGDEKWMMLSVLYRKYGYSPFSKLKGILPLALTMTFFFVAYDYISSLPMLAGTSFLFIKDLSIPDALLHIGSMHINILPVIMTAVNMLSCYIYMKYRPIRESVQSYAMAGVFLVLLYNSPSGLVLYWTCNNVFSLIKNVILYIKNEPDSAFEDCTSKKRYSEPYAWLEYLLSMLVLSIISGMYVSSSLISSSSQEFIDVMELHDPAYIAFNSFCISFGVFVLWGGLVYYLTPKKIQAVLRYLSFSFCFVSIVNLFVFPDKFTSLSPDLMDMSHLCYKMHRIIVNICVDAIIIVVTYIYWKKKFRKAEHLLPLFIILFCFIVSASSNVYKVVSDFRSMDYLTEESQAPVPEDMISLSQTHKNVMVIMLDRGIASFIPYIINEKPELSQEFSGFVAYQNTLSFGGRTNLGLPSLFGGYEYTPLNMNKRSEELLRDKHNEAISVMPRLFSDVGYDVSLMDVPYAGYRWIPDMSIYDGIKNTRKCLLGNKMDISSISYVNSESRPRNMFMFGIMEMSPCFIRPFIYDRGHYHEAEYNSMTLADSRYVKEKKALDSLASLTITKNDANGSFVMMSNSTTHFPSELQMPAYDACPYIDNSDYNTLYRDDGSGNRLYFTTDSVLTHYNVNISALISLGKYFEYLKSLGVYDNTKIIIASDHGWFLGLLDSCSDVDATQYNPLLLIKDYNSSGDLTYSDEFVTNGDVISFAIKDTDCSNVNPYTGNSFDSFSKKDDSIVDTSQSYDIEKNNGYTFIDDGSWYKVEKSVYEPENWQLIEQGRNNNE